MFTGLADRPFHRLTQMLRVLPDMVRLGSQRSVYDTVARYIKDDRLRQALTFEPLLVGGSPFRTTSIYLLIHWLERKWGVHFARGGTTSIINALVALLADSGADVRMNAPAEEIVVRNGKVAGVRLAGGELLEADVVVSNADPTYTYSRLLPAAARPRHSDRRLARVRQSMGLFVGYQNAQVLGGAAEASGLGEDGDRGRSRVRIRACVCRRVVVAAQEPQRLHVARVVDSQRQPR